ncbi:MAG: CCA tRNA nucleotidyltransferase, partial [Gemmobacter sp.]
PAGLACAKALLEAGLRPDAIRRLVALGGEDPAERLRLSRADARRLDLLRGLIGSMAGAAEMGFVHGADLARDALLARAAVMEQPLPEGWEEAVAKGAQATFPVKAADLMPALEGPALGARLAELQARWIASGFTLGREDLLG